MCFCACARRGRTRSLRRVHPIVAILSTALGTTDPAVQGELDSMRAELAALRRAQGEAWLSEARASQVRGLVQDVLADSAVRTAWAGAGNAVQTGYDPAQIGRAHV